MRNVMDKCFEQMLNRYLDDCEYDVDDDGNVLSPCCGIAVDEDVMICPKCKEHC